LGGGGGEESYRPRQTERKPETQHEDGGASGGEKKPSALGKTKPWSAAPAGEESDAQTLASLKTEPAKRKTARRRRKTSFGEKTQTAAPLAGELNQEETAAPRFREELEQGRRRISEKNANREKTPGADTKPSNPRASK
jgi:hypothetical protein